MKSNKYKHWLKIDGYSNDTRQYQEIEKYLSKYPSAKITIYEYSSDFFNWVVLLECNQDYNNLDMDVNTGSNRLRRLSRKPRNIKVRADLTVKNNRIEVA